MRCLFISIAACAFSTSAFAADALQPIVDEPVVPHISGYGEIYVGGLKVEGDSDTIWAGGADARVNIPFASVWNLQGDLLYDRIWQDDDYLDSKTAAIHAYYRDPRFAAGVFATYQTYGFSSGDTFGLHHYTVGPEAQVYIGDLTLYGQAWYGKLANDFGDEKEWGVRGVARYFVQKNFRVDGELSYETADVGVTFKTFGAALQAMYRFDSTPWSVFGRYQYEHYSIESFNLGSSNKFVVGLRASFGTDSLFDEDRSGATMDTRQSNSLISFGAM